MNKRKQGIDLNIGDITKNSGKKQLGKLRANSFWGKFAQRSNFRNSELIHDEKDFLNLLSNPTINVVDAYPISESVMLVQYEHRDEFVIDAAHSSIVIGAFTTALARLQLFTYLEMLQERVLYFDTDSVIFTTKTGEEEIQRECIWEK